MLYSVLEHLEVGLAEAFDQAAFTVERGGVELDELDVHALDGVRGVDEHHVLGGVAVGQIGDGAHVGGGVLARQSQRLDERLLVERRHLGLVEEELDALERAVLRHLHLGARGEALAVAPAGPGLHQAQRETVLAGVERELVLGDHVALGVLRLGAQRVHARERTEIDLDVERRTVLGHRRLGVEIEDDALDVAAREQRVEALEAGVEIAGRRHQADRGVFAAHGFGGLLEETHGLGVEVALDLESPAPCRAP